MGPVTALLLLLLPASAGARSLRLAPSVTDIRGGAEIELVASDGSTFESPVHGEVRCSFGVEWVPGVLRPDGRTVGCTAPPAPGGRLGAVRVAVRIDPLPDEQGSATLVYYDDSELPTVSEVRPQSADGASPARLRVLGSNFAPLSHAMRCSFGADGPTDASYVSPTEVACSSPLAPDGASRSADLRVSLDGRLFSAPGEATFTLTNAHAPPRLSRLSPHLGPVQGGLEVTLIGRGFSPAHGRLQCLYEGLVPTAASFDSAERVRCATPAAGSSAVSSVAVRLGAVGGSPPTSSSLSFVYYDPATPPQVSAVSPDYGDVHAPPAVLLRGRGFAPVSDRLVCRFGAHLSAASFVSTTSIRCAAPSASSLSIGRVSVMASIDGGASLAATGSPDEAAAPTLLLYDASRPPVTSSVAPASANVAGGTELLVRGANFAPTTLLACVFEEIGFVAASLVDATTLRCRAPATRTPLHTTVAVTLDHQTLSDDAQPFAFHDASRGSLVAAVHPPFVHYRGGAALALSVHNFDPADDVAACVFSLPQHTSGREGRSHLATAATHVHSEEVACESPRVPLASLGTVQLRLWAASSSASSAAATDGYRNAAAVLAAATAAAADPGSAPPLSLSAAWAPLTIFDANRPPTLDALAPRYAALPADGAPVAVVVLGANFAPTEAALRCQLDGAAVVGPAAFLNGSAIRCHLPPPEAPADVTLRVSTDGGQTWSSARAFTWYDPSRPPTVTSAPATIDVASERMTSAPIRLRGANFAPTGGLLCGYGGFDLNDGVHSPSQETVAATFVSASEIECPPPDHWWAVAHLHATHDGGQYWSEAPPVMLLYNSTQPAEIVSLEPAALPVDASAGEPLTLRGVHFYRPGTRDADHVCRFEPLPPGGGGLADAASADGATARPQLALATIMDATHARCATPASLTPQTAAVALSLDGGATYGASALITFYDAGSPPRLLSAAPPDGERSASTLVTLRGYNFNPPSGDAPSSALLCRFGAATSPATFVHSTALTCHAPPAAALGAVGVDLSTDGGRSWPTSPRAGLAGLLGTSAPPAAEAHVQFVYYDSATPPTLARVVPAAAPTVGGTRLTLSGANFVPPSSPSAADGARCAFRADGAPIASTPASYSSFSAVTCEAPAVDAATTDATIALVSRGGLASLGVAFTFYDAALPPRLAALQPEGLPLGSPPTTIRVHGSGFAPLSLRCHFGSLPPTAATFQTASLALCASPPNGADLRAAASLALEVSRGGRRSAATLDTADQPPVTLTYYDPRALAATDAASPRAVDMRGGTSLTVSGSGFRPAGYNLRCTVGGLHVPAHFLSLTAVRCDAPMAEPNWVGSLATVPVCLVYGEGETGACGASVTYYDPTQPPALRSIAPRLLALGASRAVTLAGANFAPKGDDLVCRFGAGTALVGASFVGGGSVACDAPPAASPSTRTLQVSTDGGRSYSRGLPFAYYDATQPAQIGAVWPPVSGLAAHTRLSLTGANFAPTASFSCGFGSLPPTAATFVNSTSAVCFAPTSPTTQTVALVLSLDGTAWSTSSQPFTFYDTKRPPSVATLSRAYGRSDGADPEPLVLTGANFAPTGAGLRCRFTPLADAEPDGADDGADAAAAPAAFSAATFVSITQIRCAAPAVARTCSAAVAAATDGATYGASAATFTYYDPTRQPAVSVVTPAFGAYLTRTQVTVYGANFAPVEPGGLHVRFGELGVGAATFVSSSVLRATTPTPPAGVESLSALVEVGLSATAFPPLALRTSWSPSSLFTFHNPILPPHITKLSPSTHRCGDGGAFVRDVRTAERTEVADGAYVAVDGGNFAPMPKLSCIYRRTGESLFEQFEHSVPAAFQSATSIRCPIPTVNFADDGLSRSSKMFFSVSNDGDIFRYSSWTFTFEGGCEESAFTSTMYSIVYALLGVIGTVVALLLLLVLCRKSPLARRILGNVLSLVGLAPADGSTAADLAGHLFSPKRAASAARGGWQRLEEEEEAGDKDADEEAPRSARSGARRLLEEGTLEVVVKGATRLVAADADGYSDPYVLVQMSGQQDWRTKVVPRTVDPVWNQTLRVASTLSEVLAANLVLTVMDQDRGRDADDYLGELAVDLQPLREQSRLVLDRVPLVAGGNGTLSLEIRWVRTQGTAPRSLFGSSLLPAARGGASAGASAGAPPAGITPPAELPPLERVLNLVGRAGEALDHTLDWAKQQLGVLDPSASPERPPPTAAAAAASAPPPPLSPPPPPPPPPQAVPSTTQPLGREQPPSAERLRTRGTLEVMVLGAEGLQARAGVAPSPFVSLKLAGRKLWKTSVQRETLHPDWGEVMALEGTVGEFIAEPMALKIVDRDAPPPSAEFAHHDALGGLAVSLQPLMTASALDFFQQTLGAPAGRLGANVSLTVTFTPAQPPSTAAASTPPRPLPVSTGSSPTRAKSLSSSPMPAATAATAATVAPEPAAFSTPPPPADVPPSPGAAARLAMTGRLECHVVRASHLMSSDANGTSDPYVTLKVGKHKAWKSSVQQKTIHPVWDETYKLEGLSLAELAETNLIVRVFDKDFLGMGDDRLGNKRVPLAPLARSDMLQVMDEQLEDANSGSITVLVRFIPDGASGAASPRG